MNIFEVPGRTVLYVLSRSIERVVSCSRSVVRRVLSVAIVLGLILFGAISFIWMVGFPPVLHDATHVGKGSLSVGRISAQTNRAGR
jgi:hypothetical protein